MKLLVKFNLAFVIVFAIGLAVAGTLARDIVRANAQQDVIDRANLLMEKAIVVSAYTTTQIAPLLETQMKYSRSTSRSAHTSSPCRCRCRSRRPIARSSR